jgi:hypothetical protein
MYLRVVGKPKKLPLRTCKDAVKFYTRKLLSRRLYDIVELELKFDADLIGTQDFGYCEVVDEEVDKPREFIIGVSPNIGKLTMLRALAHEAVHLKQFAKGEMKDMMRTNSIRWLGEHYDPESIDYFSHPWEREARGYELELYVQFMEYMREKRLT